MTWQWDQSAGTLSRDGKLVARGYSGNGRGLNSPSMQAAVGVGPIPRGLWAITALRLTGASTGPYTLVLEPKPGTDTCGRSAFRIHGDSISKPGTASHGCVCVPRAVRQAIWTSGDRELEVIA